MFRTAFKPRWLALLVLVVVAAASMARLGRWQWDRAHDTADDQVAAALARPAVPIGSLLAARQPFTGPAADRAVVAEGEFDAARQLLLPGRRLGSRTGLWVLTPLVLADGSAVGVVRGWVATSGDPAAAASAVPSGPVALTGYLRPAEPPADRAPGQTSGLPVGQLDRVDLTQLVVRWPYPLLTGYVVFTSYQPASGTGAAAPAVPASLTPLPVTAEGGGLDLRNLSYALQWFLFAGFGLFMWWRLVRDDHHGVLHDEPSPESAREGATL